MKQRSKVIFKDAILAIAKKSIFKQISSIQSIAESLDESLFNAVDLISKSRGRLIVSGVGKSGIIGQKLVATYNSTGTPSIFLHATDAVHGDLGIVQKNDIVLILSKSGNTNEIKTLVSCIEQRKNPIVSITGNPNSVLAKKSAVILNCFVDREACNLNLAPTSSTTAQLVIGDALAICLMDVNGFTEDDFSNNHPGGSIGKQLLLKVEDLLERRFKPSVQKNTPMEEVIYSISKSRFGTTAVLEGDKIVGVITDGDLRRMLSKNKNFLLLVARDIMSENPKTISVHWTAKKAMELLETHQIGQLLVTDSGNYVGVIDIHDLLKELVL